MWAIYTIVFLCSFVTLCFAETIGMPSFRIGDSIYMRFEYDGGIPGWNGDIREGVWQDKPCMVTSFHCFVVLTRGRQEIAPHEPDPFLSDPPRHGENVPTINVKQHICYDGDFSKPFVIVLDLVKYYQIDEPGIYTVYWGVWWLWSEEFVFAVLPPDPEWEIPSGE